MLPGATQLLLIACVLFTIGGIYGWVRFGSGGRDFILITVGTTIFVLATSWVFDVAVKATQRAVQRSRVAGAAGRLVYDIGSVIIWLLRAVLWVIAAGLAIWLVVWAVKSMSIPVAIIVGAIIIAGAITAARRG